MITNQRDSATPTENTASRAVPATRITQSVAPDGPRDFQGPSLGRTSRGTSVEHFRHIVTSGQFLIRHLAVLSLPGLARAYHVTPYADA